MKITILKILGVLMLMIFILTSCASKRSTYKHKRKKKDCGCSSFTYLNNDKTLYNADYQII